MSEEKLLRAIGEIDSKYIIEAEMPADNMPAAENTANAAGGAESAAYHAQVGKTEISCENIICDFDVEKAAAEGKARAEACGGEAKDVAEKKGAEKSASAGESKKSGFSSWKNWQKWAGGIAAALVICLIGYGSGVFRVGASAPMQAAETEMAYDGGYYASADNGFSYRAGATTEKPELMVDMVDMDVPMEEKLMAEAEEYSAVSGAGAESGVFEPYEPENAPDKIIYRASLRIETLDFEEAYASIKALVSENGGYFENSDVYNGGYGNEDGYKSGYYMVRIPVENYRSFMDSVGENCHVTNVSESQENINQQYYEYKERLNTLYTKEERLHELLSQAENMSEIIEIESALSDTEYQIEMYTTDLKRFDNLVDYTSIDINLEKVTHVSSSVDDGSDFSARLVRSLKRGAAAFADGIMDFVLWISYHLITFVILAVAAFLIIKFRIFQKLLSKLRKK